MFPVKTMQVPIPQN